MESDYWLQYVNRELRTKGMELPDVEFPELKIANGNVRDVRLVSTRDLLGGRRISQSGEQISPEERLFAARRLDTINKRAFEFWRQTDSYPNGYYQQETDGFCLEKKDSRFELWYNRNIFFHENGADKIGSYRACNIVTLSCLLPTHQIETTSELGEDFVNSRDFTWQSRNNSKNLVKELLEIAQGGDVLISKGITDEELYKNHSSMEPEEYLVQLVDIIASAYHTFRRGTS